MAWSTTKTKLLNSMNRLAQKIDLGTEIASLSSSVAGGTLASGKILIGSAGAVATAQTLSGDATVSAGGVVHIEHDTIVTDKILDANVTLAKLANSAKLQTVCIDIPAFIVALDGANHLNQDSIYGLIVPANATIVSAYVQCDTAIAAGDATNHYELNLYNGATEMLAANVSTVAGVAQHAATLLTVNQNADVAAGVIIKLRVDQLDDGAAGPTALNAATFRIHFNYRLR